MLNILVCVKRVPATGARLTLTEDQQLLNTRNLGFTISPHEECAVEEAIQLTERYGGQSTVLTLGPVEALDQLRESLAMGVHEGILLKTDIPDWTPMPTAEALTSAILGEIETNSPYDVLLFGNESADSGGYQVGIRVAYALGYPCITGVKDLEIEGNKAIAKREAFGGWEIYEVNLPAVIIVKEGINLPRHPSFRGKMSAKKKEIKILPVKSKSGGLNKIRLRLPVAESQRAEVLGRGPEAVPKIIEKINELGIISS